MFTCTICGQPTHTSGIDPICWSMLHKTNKTIAELKTEARANYGAFSKERRQSRGEFPNG